ncbi:MAG: hypothetical protein Kow0029_28350 [Candidatus Rifleibacteriota bacterium]
MPEKNKHPEPVKNQKTELAIRSPKYVQPKFHRTLASFSALCINLYVIMALRISPPNVELSLLYWLLFFATLAISIRERDASYCFNSMVVATTPFIVYSAGINSLVIASIIGTAVTIGFQRGITIFSLKNRAAEIAESIERSNLKRKIVKLAESDIEPELLLEEELKEFSEIEAELIKFRKNFEKSNNVMQKALRYTLVKVEHLQKDHAKVLTRSAGLEAFLRSIDKSKLENDIKKLELDAEKATDDVYKAQIIATVDMKKKRIEELNKLETCLNRVKMQKLQIYELFTSLMDKMNALKFTDIMALQASSDAMVHEVEAISLGLKDLEKGLIEAENYRRI